MPNKYVATKLTAIGQAVALFLLTSSEALDSSYKYSKQSKLFRN